MASQNHAAPWALAIRLEKWKRSKCTKVATSVRVVNSQIAGTATRAFAHSFSRAAINSTGTAAQYAAPRNAAVRGGAIVQAKYVSVCSVSRLSCRPARKTRELAAYRSHRIGAMTGRTSDAGPGPAIGEGSLRTYFTLQEVLAHPNFAGPGSDSPRPLVLLFVRDAVFEVLPQREGFPCDPTGVPARPERDGRLPFSTGSPLDEPNEGGADAASLQVPGDVDVDQL